MSFYKNFLTTLHSNVVSMTGLSPQNVVFSHQPNEPIGSYCVITQIALDRVATAKTSTLTDEDEQLWILSEYEALLRFSFLGSEAISLSADLDLALSNVVFLETLLRNNISVMRRGTVQYVPELRDTKWIDRYIQQVTFGFGVYQQQDVDVIDEITWIDPLGHTHTIP